VLTEVTAPLKITVFFSRGTRAQYTDVLARIQAANPNVTVELYDLDRYPDRARTLGVTQYGRAAIEYGDKRGVVAANSEEQLAGGILRVLRGERRRVVFTAGHGERAPGGGQDAYTRLVNSLEAENYAPEGVTLLDGSLPENTALVIVAGPKRDFLTQELDQLARHLRAGGGVVMLLDPERLPNVSTFLGSMGIRLGDDFVVDRERRVLGTDGLAAVVELFKRENPITEPTGHPIESGVVLPSARTVDAAGEVPGVVAESIAQTSPSAWVMADPDRARRGEEPSKAHADTPGPAPVVVMAEVGAKDPRGRLVVVGDADFASDAYLDLLGNRDLALNAVAWAAGEEALAGERATQVPEIMRPLSPLVVTEDHARDIFLAGVVVEPGLVLLLGLVVVGLRRRRG